LKPIGKPFGLSKTQIRSFHEPVLEYLPAFFDAEQVSDSEFEDLESLAQLAHPTVVSERIEKLSVEHGIQFGPDQMTEKLLFNDGKRAVVSGLRFLNLDLRDPFIALKANFRINEPETARVLKTLVMKAYGDADPRGFTVWEQPGLDLGQTETWSIVVGGLTETPVIEAPQRFELKWESTPEGFFPMLEQEYRTWMAENPELARFVRLESFRDLETSAAKGSLLSVYDEHGWGGIVAGKSSPLFGREALYMIELFIAKRLRGRGLAKVLESQFLTHLKTEFEIVWGHIHRENAASMKTALSLGRTPLQQEYFFSLSVD
jgi:GNAT superfamily N-acetyltransferase